MYDFLPWCFHFLIIFLVRLKRREKIYLQLWTFSCAVKQSIFGQHAWVLASLAVVGGWIFFHSLITIGESVSVRIARARNLVLKGLRIRNPEIMLTWSIEYCSSMFCHLRMVILSLWYAWSCPLWGRENIWKLYTVFYFQWR